MNDPLKVWLSEALEQRKWSQGELARQAGISRSFISRVLSGDAHPSVPFCHKIAAALGESPEKVLRLAGILPSAPAPNDNPTLQEIIELSRNLSPEDQSDVLEYVRFRFQRRKA